MKLRLTAAFMVVTALVGPLAMAADTEATPHAIVESQKDSASILPAQYKSYATKMNTVVKDYKNGYTFTIPWRVSDGVMVDMDVRSESGHIQGYSFNLAGPTQEDSYTVSFTKRNNTPQDGVSQKEWNTTWYGVPIKGLSNEQYLSIWRQHSDVFDANDIEGGFFAKKGATAARWNRTTPKSYAEMTSTESVQSVFETEFIMDKDPIHRYNLASTYPPFQKDFMEQGLLETTIPSFELLNRKSSSGTIKGVQKMLAGTSDINVVEGIKFTYPKGFTRINEKGKIAFAKNNVRLDIESFTIPIQAVSTGVPTMMGKQMLGDYYVKQLVEVNKATISRYETHIVDGNVMFYIAGHMKNPNTADTSAAAQVSFGATIILGNEGNVAVARMIGPAGVTLATPEFIDILDGFKSTTTLNTNQSSQVL